MFISNINSGYKQTYILVQFVNGQNRVHRFKIHKERNVSNGLSFLKTNHTNRKLAKISEFFSVGLLCIYNNKMTANEGRNSGKLLLY